MSGSHSIANSNANANAHTTPKPAAPPLLIICGDRIGARMAGPSIRAWEMARAIHARGLPVTLAAPGEIELDAPFPLLAYDVRGESLRSAVDAASAVLVQGMTLAQYPFITALDVPLVIDIYDPFVLENLHARADETASGRARAHTTDLAALVDQLHRGDFFLCASEAQRDYWLGCLTALDRINPATYDEDPSLRALIDLAPFGLPAEPPRPAPAPVMRGVLPGVGEDDRILLWGGGIWDWFDPLTLLHAVARVSEQRNDLRLVFLGTTTPSLYQPKQTMAARARALSKELGLTGRVVHFNDGWVPYDQRGGWLLEADVAVSTHLPHVETRFAFRTRLLDALWSSLPLLVTEGDVLADLIAVEALGRVVPPQDVSATATALAALLDDLDEGGKAAFASRFEAVQARYTWERATEALARFAAAPRRAPDRAAGEARGSAAAAAATPMSGLPRRAAEIMRDGGPLLLAEEALRYLRWLRRAR